MTTILLIVVSVLAVAFGIFSFCENVKEKNEKKKLQEKYDSTVENYQKEREKEYEVDKKKAEQKDKINTPNHADNVSASVDILHNLSQKK